MRSADGRRQGGRKWKPGWGSGGHGGLGSAVQLFPVSPLGPGDQLGCALQLGSFLGTQLGSYRVNVWVLGRRGLWLCVSLG